ncbi:MAG: hypothetical protein Q3996_02595 [Candidatus Saccharibacteria bacterium]|nr:hypothetical protein [Candidatus Saccharibacteria bacterium]
MKNMKESTEITTRDEAYEWHRKGYKAGYQKGYNRGYRACLARGCCSLKMAVIVAVFVAFSTIVSGHFLFGGQWQTKAVYVTKSGDSAIRLISEMSDLMSKETGLKVEATSLCRDEMRNNHLINVGDKWLLQMKQSPLQKVLKTASLDIIYLGKDEAPTIPEY